LFKPTANLVGLELIRILAPEINIIKPQLSQSVRRLTMTNQIKEGT